MEPAGIEEMMSSSMFEPYAGLTKVSLKSHKMEKLS